MWFSIPVPTQHQKSSNGLLNFFAKPGLTWTMSRVDVTYQWYRDGGNWKWEAVTTTHKVANGTADAVAGGPVTVAAQVQEGRYRLEVDSTGDNPTSTAASRTRISYGR